MRCGMFDPDEHGTGVPNDETDFHEPGSPGLFDDPDEDEDDDRSDEYEAEPVCPDCAEVLEDCECDHDPDDEELEQRAYDNWMYGMERGGYDRLDDLL